MMLLESAVCVAKEALVIGKVARIAEEALKAHSSPAQAAGRAASGSLGKASHRKEP